MNILQIFFNPVKVFSELKQENKFPVMAFIILLMLAAVNMILMVPITSKVTEITMSSMPLPEEQLDITMSMMHKLRYLIALGGVFTYAIMLFIYALIFYVLTVIAKPAISYVRAFTLITYSYFALLINEFINTFILYVRGLDKITDAFELMFTGLNAFTTREEAGAAIYTFLCYINPFQILYIALLSIGLKVFADIKHSKSLIICIIFLLILVIFSVGSAAFSEMKMNKAGLM